MFIVLDEFVLVLNLCAFEFPLFEYTSNSCFSLSLCSGAAPSDGPVSTRGAAGSGTRASAGDRDVAFAPVSEELPPVPVRARETHTDTERKPEALI